MEEVQGAVNKCRNCHTDFLLPPFLLLPYVLQLHVAEDGHIAHTSLRSTQPCIPPGSLNRVPASAGLRAGMSPLPGGR